MGNIFEAPVVVENFTDILDKEIKQKFEEDTDSIFVATSLDPGDDDDDELDIWEAVPLKEEEHFFTLASFVAPSASCQYCVFKQEKNEMFFYCDKKEKDFVKEFKNCQFFRQKELFKT